MQSVSGVARRARLVSPIRVLIMALMLGLPASAKRNEAVEPDVYDVMRLKSGLVLPYPLHNVFRGFARCRRGRHTHRALDIGGVGPNWGLGTPIRAMAKAKILHIGTPEADPKRYGTRDTDPGTVRRGKSDLPRSIEVAGYGTVHNFTKNYGRLRTGVLVVMKVLEGRLKGYTLKYIHLSAVHPSLKRGSVVVAGQEVGLMGGTAVQDDPPHLHLAILNRSGKAVDPGPVLQIGSTIARCRVGRKGQSRVRQTYSTAARALMQSFEKKRRSRKSLGSVAAQQARFSVEGHFDGGRVKIHRLRLTGAPNAGPLRIRIDALDGEWKPRLVLLSEHESLLHDGRRPLRAGKKLGLKTVESGKKASWASLKAKPGTPTLLLHVTGWRKPKKGARYRLVIEREPL